MSIVTIEFVEVSSERDKVPFRFEDLDGKPEPDAWGPKYSKPPKPGRPVAIDRWPSNCASGQKGDFNAARHRAKIRAEFVAAANADRVKWATGKAIVEAYKVAMRDKRAREFAAQSAKNVEHLQFFLAA
jgi:hypothetical protein